MGEVTKLTLKEIVTLTIDDKPLQLHGKHGELIIDSHIINSQSVEISQNAWNKLLHLKIIDSEFIIPPLPESLVQLNVNKNYELSELPTLPESLYTLKCSNNKITTLPTLPESVHYLNCSNNKITTLPTLTEFLHYLNCSNNKITTLPTLPEFLHYLNCSNNPLSELPPLPKLSNLIVSVSQLKMLFNDDQIRQDVRDIEVLIIEGDSTLVDKKELFARVEILKKNLRSVDLMEEVRDVLLPFYQRYKRDPKRRPTLTKSVPFTEKRITFMIYSHGGELLQDTLPDSDIQVRIFSTAGELGVCSILYDNGESYFIHLQRKMREITKDSSTYEMIKSFENERIAGYQSIIDKAEKQSDISQPIKKKIQNSITMNEHMRTYVPVIDKIFSFKNLPGTPFIKVVHYDGQDEDPAYKYLDLTQKYMLNLEDGIVKIYHKDLDDGIVKLSTIIAIAKNLGFDIINIIDLSCRTHNEDYDKEIMDSITRKEKETPVNENAGGKRKSSKKPRMCKKRKRTRQRIMSRRKL